MFRYLDNGKNGRVSDGVYRESCLSSALSESYLNIPDDRSPEGYDIPLPYVVVANDAFPLKRYTMNSRTPNIQLEVVSSTACRRKCFRDLLKQVSSTLLDNY